MSGFVFALLAVLGLATASQVHAQTAPGAANPSNDDTVHLEQMVVTGSNIPMAADALAVPVQVVGQATIQDSGEPTSTLDLLRKVAPNISGVGNENATIATNTNFGGASVSIKNLPTLVLIDGRRVVSDPAESTGGSQFVDLNMIPVAAIERIEVLQDGASAIYGSDAVGGVINVILKKNFNGWEVGGNYGFSTAQGHFSERSGYIFGAVSNDKTSITLSFEAAKSTPLYDADRPFTNPIYGTYTYPGSLEVYNNTTGADDFYRLAPGLNAPPGGAQYTMPQLIANGTYILQPITASGVDQAFYNLNLAKAQTLIQSLKRYSAMANFDHKIFDDHLQAFGNVIYSHTFTQSSLNGQPLVPYVEDPFVDVNVLGYPSSPPPAGTTFVPVTAPGNPFSSTFLNGGGIPESAPGAGDGSGYEILARERFLNYPRLYQNDSDMYRIVAGLKGDINEDYHWEIAGNINRYILHYTNPGLIDTNALNAALADGQINPFAVTQAPGAFNGVVGTAFVNMISTMNEWDAKVTGTPFTLPGGKLGFAVGAQYVLETLSAVPDVNSLPNSSGTTQGWSNATTFQQFSAHRDFDSFYGEVNIPVTGPSMAVPGAYAINVDGAVRYDSYSGKVGNSTTPQVSLSWQPIGTDLKLRASAGKSFLAPQLYNLYGPQSAGSTPDVTYTPIGGGGTTTAQFNQTDGSNPNLKDSTANSWTVGAVYTPSFLKGLMLSVDYSDIYQKLVFGSVPAATIIQDVETKGAASPYVDLVHFNSPTGPVPTAPGQISSRSPQQIYVIENLLNLSGQRVDSTDFDLDYLWHTTSFGKFEFDSKWTLYNRYLLQQVPTEQFYDYVGKASTTQGTTIPRWRTYSNLDWKLAGFDSFVGVTWVDNVTDVGVGGSNSSAYTPVASYTQFDLGVGYDFGHLHASKWLDGLSIQFMVNNVANKYPPLAVVAFPDTNSDVGTYNGSVGREWIGAVKYKF